MLWPLCAAELLAKRQPLKTSEVYSDDEEEEEEEDDKSSVKSDRSSHSSSYSEEDEWVKQFVEFIVSRFIVAMEIYGEKICT